jgi:putative Mg2+ transporter-C (MgtC) family protein
MTADRLLLLDEKPCVARLSSGSIFIVLSPNEETALRLCVALIVGALFGLNRELHGKPAGLRTHALVSLGAAAATLVILRSPDGTFNNDPNAIGRVVQGLLTGVGFLGAGVILHEPAGMVRGLTTAATIWICAVLGLICGLGYWLVLALTGGLTFLTLLLGPRVEQLAERLFKRHSSSPPDHSV